MMTMTATRERSLLRWVGPAPAAQMATACMVGPDYTPMATQQPHATVSAAAGPAAALGEAGGSA